MHIGINSRVIQNTETGIPHYIRSLYTELQKAPVDRYTFFQTVDNRKLGKTLVKKTFKNSVGDMLFDTFMVNTLIKRVPQLEIYHAPANILPLRKVKGIHYVVSIMDLSFIRVPHLSGKIFNAYYRLLVGHSLKMADKIIAISQHTKNDIISCYGIPKDKIEVIYLGIDDIFFKKKERTSKKRPPYFLTLTTHPRRKNIFALIDAMKLTRSLGDIQCVLAGHIESGPLKELEDYISRAGLSHRVKIVGYVSQKKLVDLYQHAEFFIYPSFYEGFGFPVVEAMACGCPVIVSKTSSLPEVAPDTDWHIDPYDTSDIALKIDTMLELPRKKRESLIKRNKAHALKFSWEKTAQQTHTLFQKIINTS